MAIGQIRLGDGLPTLQNTLLGWIVCGKVNESAREQVSLCGICSEDEALNHQLEKFWMLEQEDTPRSMLTPAERKCETHFNQTTTRNQYGRFVISLPFKEQNPDLGESKDVALQRFFSLERKLTRHPDLKKRYVNFMTEYLNLGHMEEVELTSIKGPHYFLPHHAVLKPESTTTKLRVVFDASAKTSTNVSLNDAMLVGPTVQDELFTTLLRFRMPRYVFTADIEKMYRQVLLTPEERKYQLILWRSDPSEPLKCYQLCTVTYGTSSAPYIATKCLQTLAEHGKERYPLGSEVLKRDFYVDDVMTGSDHLPTAIEMKNQLNGLLQTAGFNLRKWCANHPRLLQCLPREDTEVELDFRDKEEPHIKTLGLTWLPKSDTFKVKTSWTERNRVTKRTVCSDTAHLFDPLGLMSPVTVIAKIFLQQLWLLKLDWDASLPLELHTKWMHFREGLRTLDNISVPRHIFSHKQSKTMQLHIFADASEKAYGAAIYIRSITKDNHVAAQLLCSKSRVAPTKSQTVPRLELCAARLAADLATRVRKDLNISNERAYFWTDSEIVLSWINSPPSSLHTFVANRVCAIQETTNSQQWRHVKSRENPADILSRGMDPEKLKDCCLWFYGPPFLHGQESTWPAAYTPRLDHIPEVRRNVLSASTVQASRDFFETINHGNSFRKLQRIIGYVNRFLTKLRPSRAQTGLQGGNESSVKSASLSATELEEALTLIIRQMQQGEFKDDLSQLKATGETSRRSTLSNLTPFVDDRGIIRVGGRLMAADLPFDAKHQMLLPYAHPLTKLLMKSLHEENLHTGPQSLLAITRQRFWPIKGKNIARSVVQNCIRCTKARPTLMSQLMGNLPPHRVQPARPFVNAGVDFCGPIWTHYKIRGKKPQKSYIAVFCCFATRAVHMELVTDLTTDAFLGALKRFMGRRGHCRHLYCDNATNFVGARTQLAELKDAVHSEESKERILSLCSRQSIDFHFIPPRAPHFGGLWEAAVKSAKHLLQRALAAASLTYEELETVVIEVEAILNSRPLTPMSSDPNDLSALTPGHFLIGEPLTSTIHPESRPEKLTLPARWKLVSHIKNEFWKRWSIEYLNELQQRQRWQKQSQNIEPGTMVIIKEDNLPPMSWPLGRIISTHQGNDGLVRVADVRTSKNVLRRPIHKLAPLPIDHPKPTEGDPLTSNGSPQPPDVQEDAAPRKRPRRSPRSPITTLLLTCVLLPLVRSSSIKITPFKTQPGIYFENLGTARIISNEWNIIAYFEMSEYWKEFEGLKKGQQSLNNICADLSPDNPCSTILAQIQHMIKELEDNNELLKTGTSAVRRKRGALNIVGNIANGLFGILDSEYAEKMSKTIDDTRRNEEHLLKLIRNQTTIIDASVNVMKRNQEQINKQFSEMEAQIGQITNGINKIQAEIHQQNLSALFSSLATQLMLVASNIQRTQSSIIDVFTHSHNGRISPKLITPYQLRRQLALIKAHLRPSLRLPQIEENIAKLYSLMDVAGRATSKRIIFKLSIPLLNTEEFELLKVLPVPFLINNTFMAIVPSAPFLIVNLHRDQYYTITEQELQSCVSIYEDDHMCKQNHPIYQRGSNISSCEVNLINDVPSISTCKIETFPSDSQWIQLNNPNEWIFSLRNSDTIKIACGNNVTSAVLQGSGILKMHGSCTIKQNKITIQGHNIYPTVLRNSYTPIANLTQLIPPEQVAHLRLNASHYHMQLSELEEIRARLRTQDANSHLPSTLEGHEVHQFSVAYLGSALSIIIVIYLGWKFRTDICRRPVVPPIPAPRHHAKTKADDTPKGKDSSSVQFASDLPGNTQPGPTFKIDVET